MSIDATKWAWSQSDVIPTEKLILLSYADRAGETHEAWPSWSRLIADTGLDRKTIDKGLKSLQLKGKIMKTGEKKRCVFIYKLIGVEGRNNLSTGPKNGTSGTITSTKNGTTTSTKNGTTTSTKNGTKNLQRNLQRNPNSACADFSFFSSSRDYAAALLEEQSIFATEDLLDQITFYAEKSISKRSSEESIKIAVSQLKKKKWNTPSGYKNITSKSIREKEEKHLTEKKEQQQQDASAFKKVIIGLSPTAKHELQAMKNFASKWASNR